MNDELKKFSQAVLAGIRGGDTNAGTGDAVVNNFAASSFRDSLAQPAAGVGNAASQVASAEEEAAQRARQAEIQKLQDKLDPSKYKMVRREDGGFGFYDPDGQQIEISKYAEVTGQRASEILKYSDNPFDQQYVNDYENTRDLINAIQNGDNDKVSAYKANNKAIGKQKPEDVMRELIRRYPHIYGQGKYQDSYKKANNNPVLRLPTDTGASSMASSKGIGFADYGW